MMTSITTIVMTIATAAARQWEPTIVMTPEPLAMITAAMATTIVILTIMKIVVNKLNESDEGGGSLQMNATHYCLIH